MLGLAEDSRTPRRIVITTRRKVVIVACLKTELPPDLRFPEFVTFMIHELQIAPDITVNVLTLVIETNKATIYRK